MEVEIEAEIEAEIITVSQTEIKLIQLYSIIKCLCSILLFYVIIVLNKQIQSSILNSWILNLQYISMETIVIFNSTKNKPVKFDCLFKKKNTTTVITLLFTKLSPFLTKFRKKREKSYFLNYFVNFIK
jgi:hypothetical protein